MGCWINYTLGCYGLHCGRDFYLLLVDFIKSYGCRLEAERLKERQEMMKELEAVKMAAEERINHEKMTYEEKLCCLEGNLVNFNLVSIGF